MSEWDTFVGTAIIGFLELWLINRVVTEYWRWTEKHRPSSWARFVFARALNRSGKDPVERLAYDLADSASRGIGTVFLAVFTVLVIELFLQADARTKVEHTVLSWVEPLGLAAAMCLAGSILLVIAVASAEKKYGSKLKPKIGTP